MVVPAGEKSLFANTSTRSLTIIEGRRDTTLYCKGNYCKGAPSTHIAEHWCQAGTNPHLQHCSPMLIHLFQYTTNTNTFKILQLILQTIDLITSFHFFFSNLSWSGWPRGKSKAISLFFLQRTTSTTMMTVTRTTGTATATTTIGTLTVDAAGGGTGTSKKC